jgi:phage gp29-like protein
MKLTNIIPALFNRTSRKDGRRITEGGNFRPDSTVVLTAARRFNIDLQDFMQAVHSAEDVDFTRRSRLYDIYTDTLIDAHLSGSIEHRKAGVLNLPFTFVRDGQEDETIKEQIDSPWFLGFIDDVLDSIFWGFTLVQFYLDKNGWVNYYMVPRKHVDPVRNLIKHRQEDIVGTGFEEYDGLLMIRSKDPLGILARTTPLVIYKRGSMGDWAQFSELFGMPVRKYTYDAADAEARAATMADAEAQGGGSVFLCPQGTNLEFIESGNKTGSNDLYSGLVDRCNAEISKAVLGNTLTTEASETGTQALGTVHSKVEEALFLKDLRFVLNVLNYEMTDIFESLGIHTRGGKFTIAKPKNTNETTSRVNILEKALTVFQLPMDDDYLYEELSIDKPEEYERLKKELQERTAASPLMIHQPGTNPQNRAQPFFAVAPQDGDGALEW